MIIVSMLIWIQLILKKMKKIMVKFKFPEKNSIKLQKLNHLFNNNSKILINIIKNLTFIKTFYLIISKLLFLTLMLFKKIILKKINPI